MHVRCFIVLIVPKDAHFPRSEDSCAPIWMKSFRRNTTNKSSRCSFPHSRSLNPGPFQSIRQPHFFDLTAWFFRVHAHAAAALINFCEGVERDTLLPYLDPIVERLLKLLNPAQEGSRPTKRYVQEQAVTTLAMVADASETTFAKVKEDLLTSRDIRA